MSQSIAGFGGLMAISVAVVAVSAVITFLTGTIDHWIPVVGGLGIGWLAIASINR